MDKLHETIMKHMAEQDLGIDTLTQLIGTSKSTLYRKIKANTGLNTNEYIRICRLKKAAEMLSTQEYRVNEVAYLVGFSSILLHYQFPQTIQHFTFCICKKSGN